MDAKHVFSKEKVSRTPPNVTSRLSSRECTSRPKAIGIRKDLQFVYSRFTPWRTCRYDTRSFLTCIAFLGDSSQIVVGGLNRVLKVIDSNNNVVLDRCASHRSPLTFVQSHFCGGNQLILSSSSMDVCLWDVPSVSAGPKHSFDGIKAAKVSNSGQMFAALRSLDSPRSEILLYDIQTCQLGLTLSNTPTNVSSSEHAHSPVHFSPFDSMLLWNGVLWDRRVSTLVHRFDQITDFGGGGFHPARNEVIINSEVWDLRKFRLLRSVPSLDQTRITFNASGDVIYGIMRTNPEDITSTFDTPYEKHPLFSAFRTVDAVNYSDIATIPVGHCVIDFATEPIDSFVGLITMDDLDEMYTSTRLYEIGRSRPTNDGSDPHGVNSGEDEHEAGPYGDSDDSVNDFDDDEEDGVDYDNLEISTDDDNDVS
ncbi:DDB1- and CUL4-associated factor 1-like [Salvia divinorum]|uniref:DDB1- and CUL4-associated factor 1-like n=1 Tax=Salvia divinorum TaxID=28513 RepID=A0ABD1IJW7_SALDI